jgi:hypothetical protein
VGHTSAAYLQSSGAQGKCTCVVLPCLSRQTLAICQRGPCMQQHKTRCGCVHAVLQLPACHVLTRAHASGRTRRCRWQTLSCVKLFINMGVNTVGTCVCGGVGGWGWGVNMPAHCRGQAQWGMVTRLRLDLHHGCTAAYSVHAWAHQGQENSGCKHGNMHGPNAPCMRLGLMLCEVVQTRCGRRPGHVLGEANIATLSVLSKLSSHSSGHQHAPPRHDPNICLQAQHCSH